MKGPQHAQVGTGSRLLKIRLRARLKAVRAGALWADVVTQGKKTAEGPLAHYQHQRRLDVIRKKDSATVYTVEKKRP